MVVAAAAAESTQPKRANELQKDIYRNVRGLRAGIERRVGQANMTNMASLRGKKWLVNARLTGASLCASGGQTDGRTYTETCVFLLLKGSSPAATVIEGKGHLFDKQKAPFTPHELRDP